MYDYRKWYLFILGALMVLILIFLLFSRAFASAENSVTICHATGSAEHPYVRIVVSVNAENGHFQTNGTPRTGHEDDILLSGEQDCPGASSPTPSRELSPTPTPCLKGPTPTAEETPSPTLTLTPTATPEATVTATPTPTPGSQATSTVNDASSGSQPQAVSIPQAPPNTGRGG